MPCLTCKNNLCYYAENETRDLCFTEGESGFKVEVKAFIIQNINVQWKKPGATASIKKWAVGLLLHHTGEHYSGLHCVQTIQGTTW